jgi:hypothetical protein
MPISQIVTNSIANDAVVTADIANGAVTSAKMATGAARANFGAGAVLQVVQTVKTDTFTTTSSSFTTITGLSASITPSSSSSRILVVMSVNGSQQVGVNDAYLGIFRDSTQIALGDASSSRIRSTGQLMTSNAGWSTTVTFNFVDSPATTSSITYTVQTRTNGTSTSYINRGVTDSDGSIGSGRTPSSIILMEIAG